MGKKPGRTAIETRFTSLPLDQALAFLVQTLSASGAQVLSQTDRSVTGVMFIQRRPSCLIACLLGIFGLIPGIIYLIVAGKDITDPYSVQLIPHGQGTQVHPAGQGHGLLVAVAAIQRLPG